MWLVLAALRRPLTVLVAALAIVLSAGLAVRRAPVDIFPNLGVPVVYVVQPFAGMSRTGCPLRITHCAVPATRSISRCRSLTAGCAKRRGKTAGRSIASGFTTSLCGKARS